MRRHTLGQLRLSDDQRKIVMACINRFGSSREPEATAEIYPLFMDDYAADCVQRGIDKGIFNDEQLAVVNELQIILRGI